MIFFLHLMLLGKLKSKKIFNFLINRCCPLLFSSVQLSRFVIILVSCKWLSRKLRGLCRKQWRQVVWRVWMLLEISLLDRYCTCVIYKLSDPWIWLVPFNSLPGCQEDNIAWLVLHIHHCLLFRKNSAILCVLDACV